jgi:ArsR family transcriptional regulator
VCEITAIIGLSQPTISSHLKLLESAGLIEHKKDGLWVNYSISGDMDPDIKAILDGVIPAIRKSKTVKDDIRKLSKVDRDRLCSRNKAL